MKSVDWHPTKSLLVSGVYYSSFVNFVKTFVSPVISILSLSDWLLYRWERQPCKTLGCQNGKRALFVVSTISSLLHLQSSLLVEFF